MLKVPVLLITFNRPNHVRRVLEEIRKAKPNDLYVFRDGPRPGNTEDEQKCELVCKEFDELIDWPCNLHKFISNTNLGCGMGPKTALDWYFSNVEMGIVMEDDCLPNPDFFGYCENLLERYKNVPEIQMINSTLYNDRWTCDFSYGFSRYMVTGAWASWRRAWQQYDLDLIGIYPKKFLQQCKRLFFQRSEAYWWYFLLLEIQKGEEKSYWDYQKQILLFMNGAVTIHPARNLISNIGFDAEGTHTQDNNSQMGDRETFPILPLKHPSVIEIDKVKDSYCFAKAHDRGVVKDFLQRTYLSMYWSGGFAKKLLLLYKKIKGKA